MESGYVWGKQLERFRAIDFILKFCDFLEQEKKYKLRTCNDYKDKKKNRELIAELLSKEVIQSMTKDYSVVIEKEQKKTYDKLCRPGLEVTIEPFGSDMLKVVLYMRDEASYTNPYSFSLSVKFNSIPWWAESWGYFNQVGKKSNDYFLKMFSLEVSCDQDFMKDLPSLYEHFYMQMKLMMSDMVRQAMGISNDYESSELEYESLEVERWSKCERY